MLDILSNEEKLSSRFFRLAIANVLSNLLVPFASLVSVAFLGHLDEISYLTGSIVGTTLFNFLYRIMAFLRMGTTGVTAQNVGKNDTEAMLLVGMRNGLIALALGLAIVILQYPLRELGFAIFSVTPEVKASGIDYFNYRIWGAPAALLNLVLIGWLLGREMSSRVLVLSAIANLSNVALDYLLIVKLGQASSGAGLSQTLSQYLLLLMGTIWTAFDLSWSEVKAAAKKLTEMSALASTIILNGDLFIRTFVVVCTIAVSYSVASNFGTITFTESALMLQILLMTIYFIDGIGYATESLTGIFKGEGRENQLLPLLRIALGTSIAIGLTIAFACALFPQTVFGLLTDHAEITENINIYVWWLLLVLGFGSIAFMLEGYFLGLAKGRILRNVTLISVAAFAPLAIAAVYFHSNHILWLGLSVFMFTRAIFLAIQVPKTLSGDSEAEDTVTG